MAVLPHLEECLASHGASFWSRDGWRCHVLLSISLVQIVTHKIIRFSQLHFYISGKKFTRTTHSYQHTNFQFTIILIKSFYFRYLSFFQAFMMMCYYYGYYFIHVRLALIQCLSLSYYFKHDFQDWSKRSLCYMECNFYITPQNLFLNMFWTIGVENEIMRCDFLHAMNDNWGCIFLWLV